MLLFPLHNAAQEPTIDQFQIHPGFDFIRVAKEPLVQDPVDMEFDEHGRVYVLEMSGYPQAPEDPQNFPGKVLLLEDADSDGVMDRRILFADGFQYATSILPHRGGLLVASPPDLLFLKDTNGDNRADIREVLLTGFSVGNSQHNVNGMIHGLDNWIYLGNGGNSGTIHWTGQTDEGMPVRFRDLRIQIERREVDFIATTTSGFNVALDDWGRVFTTHNQRHAHHLVIPNRYFARSNYLTPPRTPDISGHKTKHLDRIYPIGIQESRVNHPEESGFFSGACGITFYGGGAFPPEFEGNLFVCDVVLNLVHRDILHSNGASFLANRARPKVEFLASANRSSRPVNITVGPDGAMYVIDMYRKVIEHPEWIPDALENQADIDADKDKGRIYRVFPKNGIPFPSPKFDSSNLEQMIDYLSHPNQWTRNTAQRLLVWWNRPESVPLLEAAALQSEDPRGRAHAFRTLEGMQPESASTLGVGRLSESLLLEALNDPDPGVREQALLIAENNIHPTNATGRLERVVLSLAHASPRVRMQSALTISMYPQAARQVSRQVYEPLFLDVLRMDANDPWTRYAVLLAVEPNAMDFLRTGSRNAPKGFESLGHLEGLDAFMSNLAGMIGAGESVENLADCLELASASQRIQFPLLDGLREGLSRGNLKLDAQRQSRVSSALERFQTDSNPKLLNAVWGLRRSFGLNLPNDASRQLDFAREQVRNGSLPTPERLDYLRMTSFDGVPGQLNFYLELLKVSYPSEIQMQSMRQLMDDANEQVVHALLERWTGLSPQTRTLLGDFLIYRDGQHETLLDALESGRILIGQLNMDLERRRRLLRSRDVEVRRRAEALFTDAGVVTRKQALESMRPALSLQGNPEKGAAHFQTLCASCHSLEGKGFAVGPDLTEIHRKSAEILMYDILDPNAAVDEEFLHFTIEDRNGDIFTGIVIQETDQSVTLRGANGIEKTVSRTDIHSMTSMGLSLMPEELETGLSPQDFADLLSYLQQTR